MNTSWSVQDFIKHSTSIPHRTASLLERTITLLHKLALNFAAEAFPALDPIDLLEPEILIALTHLAPPHRTSANLANRLGIHIRTIHTVLSRLHQQGAIRSTAPFCPLTAEGKTRALLAQSAAHKLLLGLSKLKLHTIEDLHQLTSITLVNRLQTRTCNQEPFCRICQYFEPSAHRHSSTPNHCHLLDIPLSKKGQTTTEPPLLSIQKLPRPTAQKS